MDINQYADMEPWEWPDDIGELLLRLLEDDGADARDRETAIYMAGDPSVVDDALAGALIAIVKNGAADEQLRADAAIALGPALESNDLVMDIEEDEEDEPPLSEDVFDAVQADLEKCYRDGGCPTEVRRRCLEASVRAPQPWHAAAIRSAYLSGDADWRLSAVFGMGYVEGFEKEILESLASDDPDTRCEAVSAAGNWEMEEAWPHIARLLAAGDTDVELLLAAIEAAVNIRPEEVKRLVGPLTDHADPDVADAAQEAIEMAEGILKLEDEDL